MPSLPSDLPPLELHTISIRRHAVMVTMSLIAQTCSTYAKYGQLARLKMREVR